MKNNLKTFCLSVQHLAGFSIKKQKEKKVLLFNLKCSHYKEEEIKVITNSLTTEYFAPLVPC